MSGAYRCEHCGKRLHTYRGLLDHTAAQHPVLCPYWRPYECSECGRSVTLDFKAEDFEIQFFPKQLIKKPNGQYQHSVPIFKHWADCNLFIVLYLRRKLLFNFEEILITLLCTIPETQRTSGLTVAPFQHVHPSGFEFTRWNFTKFRHAVGALPQPRGWQLLIFWAWNRPASPCRPEVPKFSEDMIAFQGYFERKFYQITLFLKSTNQIFHFGCAFF